MKTLVTSYSLTGNNRLLAAHVVERLDADHDEIEAMRGMKTFGILLDGMFNRTPRIGPVKHDPGEYDLVVLAGPVWMGKIASPLRTYIKSYRSSISRVAIISICGGSLGKNEKLPEELRRLVGVAPIETKQLYINDILPPEQQNQMKSSSAYRITQSDLEGKWKPEIDEFMQKVTTAGT